MTTAKLLDPTSSERQLDRYELLGELASGGMATVFLARISGAGGFQRFVAIKRLHPHLSNEPQFVTMFLDEARLAASIHHPNVVPILEVGESAAGYYVVMEYVEGDALIGVCARETERKTRLPAAIALRWTVDALTGLHAAHELRDEEGKLVHLVHRDVSPQNILVGLDGIAKITDFGVAHAAERLASTRSGELKGKLAYMAPEQANGDLVDRRADVFSMAVVLWETLTGARLFKGETQLQTVTRLLKDPIPRVASVEPSVSEAVDEVIAKGLARDREHRWSSAAEMADALERAATPAYPIATHREAAKHMDALVGEEIRKQRAAVKAFLGDPSRVSAAPRISRTSGTPVSAPTLAAPAEADDEATRVKPAPKGKFPWLMVALVAVVLVAIAAVVPLAMRKEAPPPAPATTSSAPSPPPSAAPTTEAAAATSAPAAPSPTPVSSTREPALTIDALPEADGPRGVLGAIRPGPMPGKRAKPDASDAAPAPKPPATQEAPPPAATPTPTPPPASPPAPPPADDGYKNPYRLALPQRPSTERRRARKASAELC